MDKKKEIIDRQHHHIWCNYSSIPIETCKMCNGLEKNYSMDGLAPDELLQKHFPNVIKR